MVEAATKLQEPWASNPFVVLGLPAGASPEEIRRRVDELRLDARLSSDPNAETSLDQVIRAQAELLDPARRTAHEVMGFYFPPEGLFQGDVRKVEVALAAHSARAEMNSAVC